MHPSPAKLHHLTLGGRPYCDMLGCMAGQRTGQALGVQTCSYPSRTAARKAAQKLRTAYVCTVAVVAGDCPVAA